MEFRNNFQELKSQIEYLSSLNKEDVTHIIKSSIYELESLNFLNEEELNEINKVTLISAVSYTHLTLPTNGTV